jgi:hypothetical protein
LYYSIQSLRNYLSSSLSPCHYDLWLLLLIVLVYPWRFILLLDESNVCKIESLKDRV